MDVSYIRGKYNALSDDDKQKIESAAPIGDWVSIEEVFTRNQLLGSCASCSYSNNKAYLFLTNLEEYE